MATSIESIPDELLSDILVRLPADYLHDIARLVCRRWYRILHSNEFVNTQIQHSTYGLLLCNRSLLGPHPIFVAATQLGQIEISEFSRIFKTEIASCNGLVVELDNKFLKVMNPAIKQTRTLPSPSKCLDEYPDTCGIAFVAASMQYKVTVPYKEVHPHLAILTVGVDNSWRDIQVEHLSKHARRLIENPPLISEGFMHFVNAHTRSVVTLDVETEILSESQVPLPHPYRGEKLKCWNYLSTGRFLSLLVGNLDFSWEVWGMESRSGEWSKVLPDINLGAHKCWLRQFASEESGILEALGWVKYPEILALYHCDGQACIFYSLVTHEISSIKFPTACDDFSAIVHKDNLIWLS